MFDNTPASKTVASKPKVRKSSIKSVKDMASILYKDDQKSWWICPVTETKFEASDTEGIEKHKAKLLDEARAKEKRNERKVKAQECVKQIKNATSVLEVKECLENAIREFLGDEVGNNVYKVSLGLIQVTVRDPASFLFSWRSLSDPQKAKYSPLAIKITKNGSPVGYTLFSKIGLSSAYYERYLADSIPSGSAVGLTAAKVFGKNIKIYERIPVVAGDLLDKNLLNKLISISTCFAETTFKVTAQNKGIFENDDKYQALLSRKKEVGSQISDLKEKAEAIEKEMANRRVELLLPIAGTEDKDGALEGLIW